MNLRSKFLLIIITFLLLQGGIFYAYNSMVVLPEINKLEKSEAEKNTHRTRNLLQLELNDMERLSETWSSQKVLPYLIEKKQLSKIDILFSQERMVEDNIHLFYLIDNDLKAIHQTSIDPLSKKPFPILNFVDKLSKLNPDFLSSQQTQQTLSGIFMSGRGPMLISARTIVSPKGEKLGWMILGQFITQESIKEFSQQMRIHIEVFPLGVKDLPEQIKSLIPVIQANSKMFHMESTPTNLKTYTYLSDISGAPSVILLSITPKNTSMLMLESIKQSYGALLAANFILVLLLLKIIQHAFVDPTRKITEFISSVSSNVDSPGRIKTKRYDELGHLTRGLNNMIIQFCNHKSKVLNAAYKAGSDRIREEMTQDISHLTKQVIPLVENLETRLWSLSLNSLEKLHAEVKYAKPGELDWAYLEKMLEMNNDYLKNEIKDHRSKVRKIKQIILRTATTVRGYSINVDHTKPFTTISYKALIQEKKKNL